MSEYLIIGASSGIGRSLAGQLADGGHRVYATYNTTKVDAKNSLISYYPLDVMQEDLSFEFLPGHIDGLVYCPGTINLRPFERIKAEDFMSDFRLQVVGAVKTIQAVLPSLRKSRDAAIILFSTLAVQSGLPYHSQVSASKGAIEGLTRALAAELAPKIRVNCIAPSLTDTPLASALLNTDQKREANAIRHPLKRVGKPEDMAGMAAFLLSEKASWITGQILHIDGGLSSLRL